MKKGVLLVLSTAFISGFSIFINQFGIKMTNPYIFTGLKNIFVALFIFAIILSLKEWNKFKFLSRSNWLTLILIGLVGGSIPFLLFFKGLSLTTAAQGSFLHKTMFIYVIVLAALFLKERVGKNLILAGLLLLLGNIFLLKFMPKFIFNSGDLLVLIAVLFWSVEQILSKKAVMNMPPRMVAWGRMFFGSIFIIIFLLVTNQFHLIFNLSRVQINWVIVTSLLLCGYVLTWYHGIKYLKISEAVCLLALGGPITTLLTLIQGKIISLNEIIGSFLIILGVISVAIGLGNLSRWLKRIFKIKGLPI